MMSQEMPLLGFGLPVSGSWATPGNMIRIAQRAEELGYASLWTFQRLLYPAEGGLDPATDASLNPGTLAANAPSYQAVHDPLLPLAYVAAHTSRIGLGTATICAPFTPPVLLAKAMVTMDHLCRGRLTVGVGMGWLPHEYVAAGVPFERRGARMDEYLRCLEALWTQDPTEFAGDFYMVPRSHTGVRSVQLPHPPVLVGGAAPAALRRAGRLAQGWICSTKQDLSRIGQAIELVREGARQGGRDPDRVRILVRAVVELSDQDPGPERKYFHGTVDQVNADFATLAGQGVTEIFVDLNFSPHVGSPYVAEASAMAEAERVLRALSPRL